MSTEAVPTPFPDKNGNRYFSGDSNFTRLDNQTKISLMAAVMYALSDSLTEDEAVDRALKIDRVASDKLRKIKNDRNRKLREQEARSNELS